MTPYSPLSVNRRFGGTYRLHLQGRRNKFSKQPASKQLASRTYFFDPEDEGDVPTKGLLTLNRLHGVISHKLIFFYLTYVRKKQHIHSPYLGLRAWRLINGFGFWE
jgi:hypothetical protein